LSFFGDLCGVLLASLDGEALLLGDRLGLLEPPLSLGDLLGLLSLGDLRGLLSLRGDLSLGETLLFGLLRGDLLYLLLEEESLPLFGDGV